MKMEQIQISIIIVYYILPITIIYVHRSRVKNYTKLST